MLSLAPTLQASYLLNELMQVCLFAFAWFKGEKETMYIYLLGQWKSAPWREHDRRDGL